METTVQTNLEGRVRKQNEECSFCSRNWRELATEEYLEYQDKFSATVARCPICEISCLCTFFEGIIPSKDGLIEKKVEKWVKSNFREEAMEALQDV